MGTGDPNMLAEVREAKQIRRLIIKKSEGVTGSEDEVFAVEEVDNVAELDNEDDNMPEDAAGSVATPAANAAREST